MSKALFLRYLHFCSDILVILVVTEWTTVKLNTHIAQYLKSKGTQTVKFGQLIEYKVRNIFLEKLYPKCGGEASPYTFIKNQI